MGPVGCGGRARARSVLSARGANICSNMAHAPYIREKARSLRVERKLTIDELSERLALSRSTIYYWVRDLPVPGSGSGGGWSTDAQRKGTNAMQREYRRQRECAYREAAAEFDKLVAQPTFRDFVCLYLAEGSKRNRNVVAICNSDPSVMRLSTAWLRRLSDKLPTFWIQYHADQDLDELRAFWGEVVRADSQEIKLQRKSNSNQLRGRTWRSVHGSSRLASMTRCYTRGCRLGWTECAKSGGRIAALGAWRRLVARSVWGRKVAGSNPAAPIG